MPSVRPVAPHGRSQTPPSSWINRTASPRLKASTKGLLGLLDLDRGNISNTVDPAAFVAADSTSE